MFFIKTLKSPSAHFDISQHIRFASHSMKAASTYKLSYLSTTSFSYHKSYFNRIICLWNSMPIIDLTLSLSILLTNYLCTNFSANFISDYTSTFHMLCPCYHCSMLPIISSYQLLTNFRTS